MSLPRPAPAAPPVPTSVPALCPACDAPVHGPFCATCGQRHADVRVPFWRWLREYAEDLTHLDSRLWRSLWTLLRHPGALTRAYVEGRRSTYVRPTRVYLTASALFFLTLALLPDRAQLLQVNARERASRTAVLAQAPSDEETALERKLDAFVQKDPKAAQRLVNQAVRQEGPKALLVLVPVFAALLTLLYRRQGRYYAEHFLFGLHFHAFTFLVLAAALPLPWEGARSLLHATVPVYLVLALRHVYGQGWGRTVVKAALLGVSYLFVLLLAVAGLGLHAIWTSG